MHIVSWNIQATQGCDGIFDAKRIIEVLRDQGPCDVICLQEVSRCFNEYDGDDQVAYFKEFFSNYELVWAAAVSGQMQDGKRQEFGNLTLVRKPWLLDSRIHTLPFPAQANTPQMPRVMVETAVAYKGDAIAILNTHLAFHSAQERYQQVEYICDRIQEIHDHMTVSKLNCNLGGAYQPFAIPSFTLLCGDLNLEPFANDYEQIIGSQLLKDCWRSLNGDQDHMATCGVYDHEQWSQGPHCRDYFFANRNLTSHVKKLSVDTKTDASDHQPISLFLEN